MGGRGAPLPCAAEARPPAARSGVAMAQEDERRPIYMREDVCVFFVQDLKGLR